MSDLRRHHHRRAGRLDRHRDLNSSVAVTLVLFAVMIAIEVSGPLLAEKRMGGTPWHAYHIAERNGLLTIIALGEGVVGTVASLSAIIAERGWTTDAVLVAVAGPV